MGGRVLSHAVQTDISVCLLGDLDSPTPFVEGGTEGVGGQGTLLELDATGCKTGQTDTEQSSFL